MMKVDRRKDIERGRYSGMCAKCKSPYQSGVWKPVFSVFLPELENLVSCGLSR